MLHLVYGGSGSGKSAYAEWLVMEAPSKNRIYLATMQPWDEECRQRIRKHQQMRAAKNFSTVECFGRPRNLSIPKDSVVLLECMSNLVSNVFYQPDRPVHSIAERLTDDIMDLQNQTKELIIVTNDIFSDGISYSTETETYRAVLGQINRNLAAAADRVTEVVFGIPLNIK